MGYDIAVIDKRHRFESRQAFDDFYAKAVNLDNDTTLVIIITAHQVCNGGFCL